MSLTDYLNSSDPAIVTAATLTKSTMDSFQAGQLSQAEYNQLIANILDVNNIVKMVNDMERQNQIAAAFNAIMAIASAVTSL